MKAGTELKPMIQHAELAARLTTLTRREAEVLEYLLKGMSNDQIALALFRSPKTIDKHCQSIYRKTGIHKRVNLVREVLGVRGGGEQRPLPTGLAGEAFDELVSKSRAWDKLKKFETVLSRSAGVGYFGDLCKALAETFEVKMAGISEVHKEDNTGVIIAFCVEGELQVPFQYELSNSACGLAFDQGGIEQFSDLSERFAGESCQLVEMGYDSYVGVRLEDFLMGPIGTLWIADDKPMNEEDMPRQILSLFAPSVAAELATQLALDNLGSSEDE